MTSLPKYTYFATKRSTHTLTRARAHTHREREREKEREIDYDSNTFIQAKHTPISGSSMTERQYWSTLVHKSSYTGIEN